MNKKLPKYFADNFPNFTPSFEDDFAQKIYAYSCYLDNFDTGEFKALESDLRRLYNEIITKLEDEGDKNTDSIRFVFSCIVEALDNSVKNATSGLLTDFFEEFITLFKARLKDVIEFYANGDFLQRNVLKIYLKRLI